MKHNALKEDHRRAEMNVLELKKAMKGKKGHSERDAKHKAQAAETEILDEIRVRLKVESNEEILIGIEKMLKILSAIPHMESFIKKVCDIVQPKSKAGSIDEVIPKLDKWKRNLSAYTEQLTFYRSIVEHLQNMCGDVELKDLIETIEGPYYLAWKMRPFIAVL
eukprot:TRINITY_DN12692_c0_g1_i1.p1 TRINITY_DN12692_c0_g1~~TRINITY_DN12692_c0_g1_i1.p1  ORF type:complete len:164 (+),score=58.12 TRINITY_DN12692_c0_g1_i1:692-1183(+)